MTAFVDATLLRFAQDAFVTDMLTNGVGLTALFNAAFQATDVQPQSFTMGQLSARAYKVPIYDSVRSNGTDERIVPDSQRVQISRVWSRLGRLDWIDVAFEASGMRSTALLKQMRQVNCYIPITVRVRGRLSDTQLDELGAAVIRALTARIELARRTLGEYGHAPANGTLASARESFSPARLSSGLYYVPSYDSGGKTVGVQVIGGTTSGLDQLEEDWQNELNEAERLAKKEASPSEKAFGARLSLLLNELRPDNFADDDEFDKFIGRCHELAVSESTTLKAAADAGRLTTQKLLDNYGAAFPNTRARMSMPYSLMSPTKACSSNGRRGQSLDSTKTWMLPLHGDARELRNLITFAVARKVDDGPLRLRDLSPDLLQELSQQGVAQGDQEAGPCVPVADTPAPPAPPPAMTREHQWHLGKYLALCERDIIAAAMRQTRNNQTQAARLLGMTPRSIYNKLRKYRLVPSGPRR